MKSEDSQLGGIGLKPLLTILILFLLLNAAYNYVPVAYNAEVLRAEMHAAVVQGMSLPATAGNPIEATKRRIQASMRSNNIPPYAAVEVKYVNNVMEARVAYTQPISVLPFGIYNYDYRFDHSTKTGTFLARE